MKEKLVKNIALGLATLGFVLLLYCIFGEDSSSHLCSLLLSLALFCTAMGNFVMVILRKIRK